MSDFAIQSRRVILPGTGEPAPATVIVCGGKIERVAEYGASSGLCEVDVGDSVVMPGLVDTHAHINEPGRTEWEGFETATRAAAAGGITTVIDMPLNSIPATTTLQALQAKADAARGLCAIDYGFWGGVVPGNARELAPMIDAGILGFKAFLIESGVAEFPMAREDDLREAMPILARAGVPLLIHAELEGETETASADPRLYKSYLESRPPDWEIRAVQMMIRLARETSCRVHIVHLSAAGALSDLKAARAAGIPISAETCPHYLTFTAEEIPDGATSFKCAPPIREAGNREKLWQGLIDQTIDFIVSDHSPCTPQLKSLETGNFEKAWGGIAGLQFSLPVVWTEMRARGLHLRQLTDWMSARTARFAGLRGRKGEFSPGFDADITVWNPDQAFRLESSQVKHRHSLTPYRGRSLYGVVQKTFVRGVLAFDSGAAVPVPQGVQLKGKS